VKCNIFSQYCYAILKPGLNSQQQTVILWIGKFNFISIGNSGTMKWRVAWVLLSLAGTWAELHAEGAMTRVHEKTFNVAFGGQVGIENGTMLRLEYEDNRLGKFMASGLAGAYLQRGNYLFMDGALGYGYPLKHSPQYALYLNSHVTWMHRLPYLDEGPIRKGPSLLLEGEWRYSWRHISVHALFGNRLQYSTGSRMEHPVDYSWFLRVGVVFRMGETGMP